MKVDHTFKMPGLDAKISDFEWYYWVATISRLLKITGLFCRI